MFIVNDSGCNDFSCLLINCAALMLIYMEDDFSDSEVEFEMSLDTFL